jgi:hypothetical protein
MRYPKFGPAILNEKADSFGSGCYDADVMQLHAALPKR